MQFTIAIQPDDYGRGDAYSPMWMRLLQEAGHITKIVNVYSADIFQQLHGCHAFMWRQGHFPGMRQIARRLLPVLERDLGLVVYPDQNTCWHYDDKISQSYLLEAKNIPIPRTWVWYDAQLATDWARTASYPLVLKLWSGASSENVVLVSSPQEAKRWIEELFSGGLYSLSQRSSERWTWKRKIRAAAKLLLKEIPPKQKLHKYHWELHKNYILFQEFLPDNHFDHRIVVIGNRAFGFRRLNRPNDFRASGSQNYDTDPSKVDLEAVRLAFQVARTLNTQSIAADVLRRGNERVVAEISYTYPHFTIRKCPGHWEMDGPSETGEFVWRDGHMWPEEAQIEDLFQRLDSLR